jgi:hypothetical protein
LNKDSAVFGIANGMQFWVKEENNFGLQHSVIICWTWLGFLGSIISFEMPFATSLTVFFCLLITYLDLPPEPRVTFLFLAAALMIYV